jgi:N-acetylneuraminic acid mutarotase
VNLGPALNTDSDEGNAAFSRDGRLLFFQSKRNGGLGGIDIWLARRNNPRDDFDWQPAVNLGSGVNSSVDDNGPTYFEDIARGTRQLYFGSARTGGPGGADIYVSAQSADGSFGPATLVTELSSTSPENDPSIRHDGLEIFFQSSRAGSIGTALDLWVATRGSTLDAWSTPVNLGDAINTTSLEQNPYLSSDGITLFFASDRAVGSGGLDLYMATRTALAAGPNWTNTGNLNQGRQSHTATLLPNGKVLIAGGNDGNRSFKSAELYDPATGRWSRTSDLNADRDSHTATLLPNGKVLVAGGFSCGPPPQSCFALTSAELYDPATGIWTVTGSLNTARNGHNATLLPNGKVLVVSGDINGKSAELYDAATGIWSPTGSLNLSRYSYTLTLLSNGKVLVAGGADDSQTTVFNSAELYDPATGLWSSTGNLVTARAQHTATLLTSGKVMVAGGFIDYSLGSVTDRAELYDPTTGLWSSTGNLNRGRAFHVATLLTTGKVLVAGGFFVDGFPNITNRAELYDPTTGIWSNTTSLNAGRRFFMATLLLNGKVIAAGGNGFNAANTSELYGAGSEPVVLPPDQVTIKSWTYQGRTYAHVKLSFSNSGYSVIDWGLATRSGNDFTVNALVERSSGASVQAVTTTAQIYDLGPLANGTYNFNFKTSGTLAKTLQFTISSTVPPPNPIDTAREFVKQQYRDFLNREADQAGEDFWTDNITKCNDPARRPAGQTVEQCTLRQRETTSGAFFLSPEFQYTGYYVYRAYQGALGRQPKLSEFIPDTQFVGNGIVVNGQLSAAKINQNKADFAQQFVNCTDATKYRCAEFKAIYDPLSNQQYVDKLFQTTGVNASAADGTALVNGLNAATETRATVLQKVVDGINVISEGNQQFTTTYGHAFYDQQFNRAFVQLEYFGYMKRDPDDAGYAFWLGKLNQFGGDFINAEMVLAFISSPEYRARFGQP